MVQKRNVESLRRHCAPRRVGLFSSRRADDVAEQVQREMAAGERFRAMELLDAMANEIHPLT